MEGIYAYADQIKVYKAILDATQEVQKWLRYHSGKIYNSFRQSQFIKILICDPIWAKKFIAG
jgi:hypothetical protein